jgi:hypothetical protein
MDTFKEVQGLVKVAKAGTVLYSLNVEQPIPIHWLWSNNTLTDANFHSSTVFQRILPGQRITRGLRNCDNGRIARANDLLL